MTRLTGDWGSRGQNGKPRFTWKWP